MIFIQLWDGLNLAFAVLWNAVIFVVMPCLCCAMIQCCPLIFGNAMVGLIHTHLRVLMWIFYILLYSDGTNLGIFYVLSPIILCSSASGKHESNLISFFMYENLGIDLQFWEFILVWFNPLCSPSSSSFEILCDWIIIFKVATCLYKQDSWYFSIFLQSLFHWLDIFNSLSVNYQLACYNKALL